MSIRTLNNITIQPSIDFIGKIYSLNFEIPHERDSSAKLHLNLINEAGIYPPISLSYLTPYEINVFGQYTFYMYLTGYTEDSSGSHKTLNLTFEDGSHILDRVYVGLLDINVEANPFNHVTITKPFARKIICDSCSVDATAKRFVTINEIRPIKTTLSSINPIYPGANQGHNVVGDNQNGGFILVGEEQYTKTFCDVPEIKYNFTQLKAAAQRIGIYIDIPDIFPEYAINAAGTLRETLSAFCNKFAVSPVYNFTSLVPNIKYIDLKTSTSTYGAIAALKNAAKLIKSTNKDETVVLEIQDSESAAGTYKQNTSLSASVPPDYSSTSIRELNYLAYYEALKLEDLYDPYSAGSPVFGRSIEQLMISSYLAAAYPTYRTLYNLSLRGQVREDLALAACGFQTVHKVPSADALEFLANNVNITGPALLEKLKRFNGLGPNSSQTRGLGDPKAFDLYIGNYWPHVEDDIIDLEREMNGFIGNYFYNYVASPSKASYCMNNSILSSEVRAEMKPEGKVYFQGKNTNTCDKAFPFKKLLQAQGVNPFNFFGANNKTVRILDRGDNQYGFTTQFIGNLLKKRYAGATFDRFCEMMTSEDFDVNNSNPFENFRPEWMPFSLDQVTALYKSIKGTALETSQLGQVLLQKINDNPNAKDLSLHIGLVPSVSTIKKILSVSSMFQMVNTREKTWMEKASSEQRFHCPPNICQKQSDYNVDTSYTGPCACVTPAIVNPSMVSSPSSVEWLDGPDVVNVVCPAFRIELKNINGSTAGNIFDIAFPFGSLIGTAEFYRANYKETLTRHAFHYGLRRCMNDFSPPGNVSSIKVVHEEIGAKVLKGYDTQISISNLSNPHLIPLDYITFNGQILTFAGYFNLLKGQMSQLNSLFPRKSLKIKCAGTKFGSLLQYMDPAKGFTSVSIHYDKDGVKYDLNFESRPPKIAEAFLDLFKEKMAIEKGQR